MLKEKNSLMKKDKYRKASTLADLIGVLITKGDTKWLSDCDPRIPDGAKAM